MLTNKDRLGIKCALANWLRSQQIEPLDAAFILAEMAGTILAQEAGENEQRRLDGLTILRLAMDQKE